MWFGEATGQGWLQIGELALAFGLSALIGLEREIRHKSAGLRTHTLVGFAAALIMLVSKYGFGDVLSTGQVVLDPSRIAAQIVTGIGFIGGGLIFVRRDSVRGLTTAAIVWLTTAVGMACGASACLSSRSSSPRSILWSSSCFRSSSNGSCSRWAISPLQVSYEDGRGILRDILVTCTQHDFSVSRVRVERQSPSLNPTNQDTVDNGVTDGGGEKAEREHAERRIVTVALEIRGARSVAKLASKLAEIAGVVAVNAGDENVPTD